MGWVWRQFDSAWPDETRFVKFKRRDAALATRIITLSDGLIVSDKINPALL